MFKFKVEMLANIPYPEHLGIAVYLQLALNAPRRIHISQDASEPFEERFDPVITECVQTSEMMAALVEKVSRLHKVDLPLSLMVLSCFESGFLEGHQTE